MKPPVWFRILSIVLTWGLACGLLFWVISLRFPMDGTARFSFAFDGTSPWFNPFQPGERVTSPGPQPEGWVGQRILGDPVYGAARLPGAYDTVDINLEVRSLRQPIAELGLLRDEASFAFEMNPLWFEALSSGWHKVKFGNREGYVQDGAADSALLSEDFSRLMVWQADLDTPAWSDEPTEWKTYKLSLRGAHDFHVVPSTDGHIRMRFLIQDINRSRVAQNQAAFRLMRGEETVWTESLSVSGLSDTRPSAEVEKNIDISGLKPGVYRLSFLADDDFFIRSVSTNAKRWVIGPRLYVGDTVAYADSQALLLNWSTNSHHLAVETFHKEGLQRVRIGAAVAEVKRTHTSYPLNRIAEQRTGPLTLQLERGSLRMVGDGYFSPDPASLFYPSPRRLTADADPAAEGILAVLTPLEMPERLEDGWWRVRTSWKLPASQEPLRIALGLPGIVTRVGAFDIRHAELTYRRPPLSFSEWWRAVRRELAAAWRRL